jgi:hypothetical protein
MLILEVQPLGEMGLKILAQQTFELRQQKPRPLAKPNDGMNACKKRRAVSD